MKKVIIFLFVLTIVFLNSNEDNIVIPRDSIRFRIIANSNTPQDQLLKMEIRTDLIPVLSDISTNVSSLEDARLNINKNLTSIEKIIANHTSAFSVNFGQNYFPKKIYKNVIYDSGNYESLVITLGDGIGDNWWCVLFPPLCLLEAKANNLDDVTYESYFKNIINKYL